MSVATELLCQPKATCRENAMDGQQAIEGNVEVISIVWPFYYHVQDLAYWTIVFDPYRYTITLIRSFPLFCFYEKLKYLVKCGVILLKSKIVVGNELAFKSLRCKSAIFDANIDARLGAFASNINAVNLISTRRGIAGCVCCVHG
jgi:hypothetical protein